MGWRTGRYILEFPLKIPSLRD